jgi:hypothetical protein
MDNKLGRIHSSYVENCLHSRYTCKQSKLRDEVHRVHHHLLNTTLDKLYTKYVVL